MPIDYKHYPKNWKELRKQVLERAQHKCEWPGCGISNYEYGYRDKTGKWYSWQEIEDALELRGYDYFDNELSHHIDKNGTGKRGTKIVLTIAHLDHDETNHDVTIDRLAAYCQYHHLNYDKEEKKKRMNNKRGIQELFEEPPPIITN